VNNLTLRAFNELYFRTHGREGDAKAVPWDTFFYPLDGLRGWNRMYGPRGFFQYQCVVPEGDRGRAALEALLAGIAASGQGSFLGVLKRFGAHPGAGMLSFPRPGYTLALDFPNRGEATAQLLDALDLIVLEAGGRVYAAKDARMSARAFRAFYPEWQAFARFVDPRFSSSFWRRVTAGAAEASA
jgi:FAD/FMN-containing dehydrogenase